MSIEAGLFDWLTNRPGVAALIGTRLRPGSARTADARPYVVYQTISSVEGRHMGASDGLTETRMQLDVVADSHASLIVVADALRLELHGFQGGQWGSDGNYEQVRSVTIVGARDDFTDPSDGSELGRFRRIIDVSIWHDVTVPTFA